MYNIVKYISIMTFFLITFLPRSHSIIRMPFIGISLLICCVYLVCNFKKIKIHSNTLGWIYGYIIVSVIWIFIGALNGNNVSGLLDYIRLYVIWIIVYGIMIIVISNGEGFKYIFKVLKLVNFLIAVYTILIYVDSKFGIGLNFLYYIDSHAEIGIHDGYVQITTHNLGTLLFTTPFLFGINQNLKGVEKRRNIFNIIISIIAIIISGRRALLLVIPISIILIVFINIIENKLSGQKLVAMFSKVLVIFIISIFTLIIMDKLQVIKIEIIFERLLDGFSNSSDNVRYTQTVALINGFKENFLFGSGFAKGVSSVVRSQDAPWLYEVIYAQRLYNMGIVGFGLFVGLLVYNCNTALKVIKKYNDKYFFIKGLFLGYMSFLIMCFTNPYIESFDFMWVLIIIPGYYNYIKIKESKKTSVLNN